MSERTKKIIKILALLIFFLPYAVEKTGEGREGDRKITVKALLWESETTVRDGKAENKIRFPYGKPNLLNRLSDRKDDTV